MSSYLIPPRSTICAHCHAHLQPGCEILSVLNLQKGGYSRHDYCLLCEKKAPIAQESVFWRQSIAEKASKKPERHALDDDLLHKLMQYVSCNEPSKLLETYVLALYLNRRRRLEKRFEKKGLCFFEIVGSEEVLAVAKQTLHPLQLRSIESSLKELFCSL